MSKPPTAEDRARMDRGDYRPGDLVNGHRLTVDGQWVAVPVKRAKPVSTRMALAIAALGIAGLAVPATAALVQMEDEQSHSQWRRAWYRSDYQARDDICDVWLTDPKAAGRDAAEKFGVPGKGDEMVEYVLNRVC